MVFWHNLTGDFSAKNRRNYTTDQAGTTPVPATNPIAVTPLDLGVRAWWDASDVATVTADGSNRVSQWNDKSGNGYHLTNTGADATKAIYTSGQYLEFDGVDDILSRSSRLGFPVEPAITVIAVVEHLDGVGGDGRFFQLGYDSGGVYALAMQGVFASRYNNGNTQFLGEINNQTLLTSWAMPASGQQQEAEFYLNGDGQYNPGSASNPPVVPSSNDSFVTVGTGYNRNASSYTGANCRVHEIIVLADYNDAKRRVLEGYVAHKWGLNADLVAGHPYKAAVPERATYGTARHWRIRQRTLTGGTPIKVGALEFYSDTTLLYTAMTSNTTPAPQVASSSGDFDASTPAWKAFDSSPVTSFWQPPTDAIGNWLALDFGTDVTPNRIAISSEVTTGERPTWDLEYSADGVSWTPTPFVIGVQGDVNPTLDTTADEVRITDDLELTGTGPGADDNWTLSSTRVLHCNSIDVAGYDGEATVGSTSTIEVIEDVINLDGSAGNHADWRGYLRCRDIIDARSGIGDSAGRANIRLGGDTISSVAIGNTVNFEAVITLTQATTLTADGNGILRVGGRFIGAQDITVDGSLATTPQPMRYVPDSAGSVNSVEVISTEFQVAVAGIGGESLQGIVAPSGQIKDCVITLSGTAPTLRLWGTNSTQVEWGNPVVAAAGATSARLLLDGSATSYAPVIVFPMTLDADLILEIGTNVAATPEIWGASGFSGTDTPASNAGAVSGVGKLFVLSTGATQIRSFYWRFDEGAPLPVNTGGIQLRNDNPSFRFDAGLYAISSGTRTFGGGEVEVYNNTRFEVAVTGFNSNLSLTNDIRVLGTAAGSADNTPWFLDTTPVGINPTITLTGMVYIDAPEVCWGKTGGTDANGVVGGGITLLQDTRIRYQSGNNKDFLVSSPISGAGFNLALEPVNSVSHDMEFSAPISCADLTIDGGNSTNSSISAIKALSNILSGVTGTLRLVGGQLVIDASQTFPGVLDLDDSGGWLRTGNNNLTVTATGPGPHKIWGRFQDDQINSSNDLRFVFTADGTTLLTTPGDLVLPGCTFRGDTTITTAAITARYWRVVPTRGVDTAVEIASMRLLDALGADVAPTNMTANNTPGPFVVSNTDGDADAFQAFDGNPATASTIDPSQFLAIDLGSGAEVAAVELTFLGGYATEWRLEYSTNGTTWNTAREVRRLNRVDANSVVAAAVATTIYTGQVSGNSVYFAVAADKTLTLDEGITLYSSRPVNKDGVAPGFGTLAGGGAAYFNLPDEATVPWPTYADVHYDIAEVSVLPRSAGTVTITGHTFPGDFYNILNDGTLVLAACTLQGDFIREVADTAPDPASTIFTGNGSIAGGFYFLDPQVQSGAHAVLFESGSVLTVEGNFLPGSHPNGDAAYLVGGESTDFSFGTGSTAALLLRGLVVDLTAAYDDLPYWDSPNNSIKGRFIIDPLNLPPDSVVVFDTAGVGLDARVEIRNSSSNSHTVEVRNGLVAAWLTFTNSGDNGPLTWDQTGFPEVTAVNQLRAEAGTDITAIFDDNLNIEVVHATRFGQIGTAEAAEGVWLDLRNFTSVSWAGGAGYPYIMGGGGTAPLIEIWGEGIVAEFWNLDFDGLTSDKGIIARSGFEATDGIWLWGRGVSNSHFGIDDTAHLICNTLYGPNGPGEGFLAPGLDIRNGGKITCYNTVDLNANITINTTIRSRFCRIEVTAQSSPLASESKTIEFFDHDGVRISPNNMTNNSSPAPFVTTSTSSANDAWQAFDGDDGTGASMDADDGEFITIDLGKAQEISSIRYLTESGTQRVNAYEFTTSLDGITWDRQVFAIGLADVDDTYVFDACILRDPVVEVRPRGPGAFRLLDLAGKSYPNLTIIREAASFPGDEVAYAVATAAVPDPGNGGHVLVQNEAAAIALTFALGGNQTFTQLETNQVSTGPIAVDFNGFDLSTQFLDLVDSTSITAPLGSAVRMKYLCDGFPSAQIQNAPTVSTLPEIYNEAAGVFLDINIDILVEAFYQIIPGTTTRFNGRTIDASGGVVEILDGVVSAAHLPGTTFIADFFHARSVDMAAASPWFIHSTQTPLAELMLLQNADASGGASGVTANVVDGGGNVNWLFPIEVVSANVVASLGLGIGLGLTDKR